MKEDVSADLIEIGNLIRKNRENANMTQSELAEKAGIYDKSVSRLETGTSKMRLDTFFSLAEALNVSPNDISPERLVNKARKSQFSELESRYSRLNKLNRDMFLKMMNVILDSLLQEK